MVFYIIIFSLRYGNGYAKYLLMRDVFLKLLCKIFCKRRRSDKGNNGNDGINHFVFLKFCKILRQTCNFKEFRGLVI